MALRRPSAGYDARETGRGDRLDQQLRTLEVASRIAKAVASLHGLQEIAYAVTALVSEGLGIEHAGLFVVDQATQRPVLSAASSADTSALLVERQVLLLDQDPVVRATATGLPQTTRTAATVAESGASEPSILFELALPLTAHGQVVGILDLQSMRADALNPDDMTALSMLANQLGLAIETLRLTEQSRQLTEALRCRASDEAAHEWALVPSATEMAFGYSGLDVTALGFRESATPPQRPEITERPNALRELRAPIVAGDRILGFVVFRQSLLAPPWGEDEITFVAAICGHVGQALERARLLREAQATNEWRLRQGRLTERIWLSTADVERVLAATIQELGAELGATGTVRLGVLPEGQSDPGDDLEPSTGIKAAVSPEAMGERD
jgi:GAF domain-containing protein